MLAQAKVMREALWLGLLVAIGGLIPVVLVNRQVAFPFLFALFVGQFGRGGDILEWIAPGIEMAHPPQWIVRSFGLGLRACAYRQ